METQDCHPRGARAAVQDDEEGPMLPAPDLPLDPPLHMPEDPPEDPPPPPLPEYLPDPPMPEE